MTSVSRFVLFIRYLLEPSGRQAALFRCFLSSFLPLSSFFYLLISLLLSSNLPSPVSHSLCASGRPGQGRTRRCPHVSNESRDLGGSKDRCLGRYGCARIGRRIEDIGVRRIGYRWSKGGLGDVGIWDLGSQRHWDLGSCPISGAVRNRVQIRVGICKV